MVKLVIRFAPVGIFGLRLVNAATTGFSTLWGYAHLLVVLIGLAVRCWSRWWSTHCWYSGKIRRKPLIRWCPPLPAEKAVFMPFFTRSLPPIFQ